MGDERRTRFSLQISIGDVITLGSLIVGGTMLYSNLHEEIAVMKVKLDYTGERVEEMRGKIISYEEILREQVLRKR